MVEFGEERCINGKATLTIVATGLSLKLVRSTMPDGGPRIARGHIFRSFSGPGIDPPSLDKEENSYGWLSQDTELLPKRVIPAAVLVPLINRGDGITILLTQRPRHLKSHPGQVSFPGGKKEPCDETAEDTFANEEEIGCPAKK